MQKFSQFLIERKSTSVIVVDVQPAYANYNRQNKIICEKIIRFVAEQSGRVLMFVNAEDAGLTADSVSDIRMYWEEVAMDYDLEIDWSKIKIVDKGYGYLRSWMDEGIPASAIISVIREMYKQRVNSSEDLFGGSETDEYMENMKRITKGHIHETSLTDPIYVNWVSLSLLKQFNGSYIVGGGKNECLKEVQLMMSAFNIKAKEISELIY